MRDRIPSPRSDGERVRGGHYPQRKTLPLTPSLSP
jgi:hypothetical protein